MKTCPRCKENKPLSKFHKNRKRTDGHSRTCKQCAANGHRLRKYGLTESEYVDRYNALGGRCPLCSRWYEDLTVDHSHETGEVRGLLCISCNRALGYVENREWLVKAFGYLRIPHAL